MKLNAKKSSNSLDKKRKVSISNWYKPDWDKTGESREKSKFVPHFRLKLNELALIVYQKSNLVLIPF